MSDNRTIFKHNPDCPVREIGDGLVIMAPEGDVTHSLEDIGAFIWSQIDGKRTLGDILDVLVSSYDVSREVAENDLQMFLKQLLEAGLVLVEGG